MATGLSSVSANAQEINVNPRQRVDISQFPWSAVGQVNNAAYGRCSGVLIAPRKALTAAHCLYNQRTRQFLRPPSVHFVLGYDRGDYVFSTTLSKIEVPPDYDPSRSIETIGFDMAILHLAEPAPDSVQPLAIDRGHLELRTHLMAAGYGRDRLYALTAVSSCTVARSGPRVAVIENCPILDGYSGGPLINKAGRVVAIQVARADAAGAGVVLGVRPTSQFD